MPAVIETKQEEEQSGGPSDFRIGFLVHDVSRLRKTLFDQEIKHLGITRAQWWALAQLSREDRPEGMLQIELARCGPPRAADDIGKSERVSGAAEKG